MVEWMAHAALVGLLIFLVATIVEKALPGLGLPRRAVWAGSIVSSVLLPLASIIPRGEPIADAAGSVGSIIDPGRASALALPTAAAFSWADPLFVAGWAIATAAVSLVLIRYQLEVRRDSSRWVYGEVGGSPAMISPSTGPAVVGFIAPVVVVPRWAITELDEQSRRLIYVHEREHIRAHDPLLLLMGLVAAALFPWNPAIWLECRALKQAIELDCDSRVVRLEGTRAAYGALLLDIAGRLNQRPGTSIAVTSPPLEQRIRSLTGTELIPEWPTRAILVATAYTVALLAARLPSPPPPPIVWRVLAPRGNLAETPSLYDAPKSLPDSRPRLANRHETPGILDRSYPPLLRDAGIGGTAVVWVYVNERGGVDRTAILESSGSPELDRAAESATTRFRYRPAVADGRTTAGWIQQPISFRPSSSSTSNSGPTRLAIWTTPTTAVAMR